MNGPGRISRRRCLQIGSIGLTGLSLPRALKSAEPAATARACLFLFMDGGPSQIDLFDMKPQAPAEIRGPYRSIASSVPGVELCEHLPRLARELHRATLVRSMCHEQLVHDPAVYEMLTGVKHVSSAGGLEVEPDDFPQVGTAFGYADRRPAAAPKVIELPETMKMQSRVLPGQNAGFLGPSFDPLRIGLTPDLRIERPSFRLADGVPVRRMERRSRLLSAFNHELAQVEASVEGDRLDVFQQQALEILRRPQVEQAFDLDRESPATRDRYGRHRHGQSVLLARRLIEAGVRFVTVYWGHEDQDWADGRGPRPANNPWDTHRNHFPLTTESLVPRADQTLSALLADLDDRGMLDETLVVWTGDFGRTPRITRPWASRDHWPFAFSTILAGGGIARGRIHGRTDDTASYVTDDPVSPADLTATIFRALGVDPRTPMWTPAGTTLPLSSGRAVDGLFA